MGEYAFSYSGGSGVSQLVYRYTVTGSDKVSIDTAVDAPDKGTNDWTNADLFEIYFYSRTDDSGINPGVVWNLNNDGGSNYDYQWQRIFQTSASSTASNGNTAIATQTTGAGVANTTSFGYCEFRLLNPLGGTGYKPFTGIFGYSDPGDVTQVENTVITGQWRSTSAINRIAVACSSGGTHKFKVGTQLLIYKRLAS